MGDPRGFLTTTREAPTRRPVDLRLMDWREVYEEFPDQTLEKQAGRCMNCGIPFCHQGCPLGNLIPEWNDLVYRDEWREAIERLHATNNFPEFTGTLCPAPCEAACVLAINSDAVTIKQVELQIVDHAWREGWVVPQPPPVKTGKKVAVVGSGPSGLAAAGWGTTQPSCHAWSTICSSICLIVTASLLIASTQAASHGAGHSVPVNSGKLFVACSRSMASRHSSRWTRSFHSGIRLPSGQPAWQNATPQSIQRLAWTWTSAAAGRP